MLVYVAPRPAVRIVSPEISASRWQPQIPGCWCCRSAEFAPAPVWRDFRDQQFAAGQCDRARDDVGKMIVSLGAESLNDLAERSRAGGGVVPHSSRFSSGTVVAETTHSSKAPKTQNPASLLRRTQTSGRRFITWQSLMDRSDSTPANGDYKAKMATSWRLRHSG
jgi:hypothetical protein